MRPSLFLILAAGLAWALQAEAGVETRPAGDETTSAALEVLVDTCLPCHYPESSDKKAVRDWPDALDLPATLAAEDFVTPGDAEDSLVFLMVLDGDMPPEDWAGVDGSGPSLSEEQTEALRSWLDAGAHLPTAEELSAARRRGEQVLARVLAAESAEPQEVQGDETPGEDPPAPPSFGARVWRLMGHSHASVVHFPIAFIYGAALAELLLLLGIGASWALPQARRFCLYLAAISSIPAAGVGWIVGESVRAETTLTQHRWLGVGSALMCIVCLWVSERSARGDTSNPWSRTATWLIFLTAALVAITGHWGGVLTFGEAYFEF
ncbi:MAG: hypothetical protein CMJ98_07060 [Planctomycetes bacterium]|nr:hypothetical protein [Planctomycetota bacterium]HJM57724.1 hypothetical protein [Planctomycetota bacterium]